MGFEKGNTYGKGRPPGSKNKVNDEIRESLETLTLAALQKIDLDKLETPDLLRLLNTSLAYVMPKLKQIENNHMNITNTEFNIKDVLRFRD